MKKKMNLFTLSLLVCGALGVSAAGVAVTNLASAQTEPTAPPTVQGVDISSFVMEKGAGVRVSGDGLRFSADMDRETYDALEAKGASYGMLIVPKNYLTEGYELTEENVFVNNKFYFEEENPNDGRRAMINLNVDRLYNKDDDDKMELYGAMTNIGTANIYREFVGLAYVQVPVSFDETTGEPTAYEYKLAQFFNGDMENNTRSPYYVAQLTLESNWTGDMAAVEANYITTYDGYIADYGYTFGYTEKHVLTKLDGSQETLAEEIKFGALNDEVSAEFFNDKALYSTYYCTDSEMPTSKLYANGKTTLEVNYKEVEVDFENLVWSADFTDANYANLLTATEWGENTTEDPYSVTTEIPEGGVAGSYLYYSGAADKAREDIQVQIAPAYSKGYYQSLLNTGLPFVVKYDVYVENANADYSGSSAKIKCWNGTSSFNSSFGQSVTMGQWKTVTFDLDYLVKKWGNYRLFGLELATYKSDNQKVNFYIGNIRIEEKPRVFAVTTKSSWSSYYRTSGVPTSTYKRNTSQLSEISAEEGLTITTAFEGKTGKYIQYKQNQKWDTACLRVKPKYGIDYYKFLVNSDKTFKVYFDVCFKGDGAVAPYKWVNGTLTKQGNSKPEEVWYEYSCTLEELVKDWENTDEGKMYGPRLFNITGLDTTKAKPTYVWIGNIRLVEEAA